jgi:hypothetical protein
MPLPGPPHTASTGESAYIWRLAGLSAAFVVFTAPPLLQTPERAYPVLTIVFAGLLTAVALMWDRVGIEPERPGAIERRRLLLTAAMSVIGLSYVAYGWVDEMLWRPPGADMLIVIREAGQRILSGRDPYFTYRNTYDAPWDMVLPYGPVLWGPYLVPQMLQMDLRLVTIAGELFVPAGCAIAATVEVVRGRLARAAAWVVLLAVLVSSISVRDFTPMGHTPVYWPLLPLFAALVTRQRWLLAAFALGVLIVARSTMVALAPILVMAIWKGDRPRLGAACAVLGLTVAAVLAPFVLWDPHAIWDGMVASYPRIMKGIVWPSADRGVINTFGVTGWLLSHGRGDLVEWAQLMLVTATGAAAWLAIRRGARPLPWMGLALLAFSMTSLWPVYYIYYDVLLLFVSAAMVETLAPALRMQAWIGTLAAILALVAATTRAMTVAAPSIEMGSPTAQRALLQGLETTEREGDRHFAWIVNQRAVMALPRGSTAAADIAIDCRPFLAPGGPPQVVTAILNGQALWTSQLRDGWQTVRVPAPQSTWRIGFNQLEILSSSVTSPRDTLPGSDTRARALALSRIEVIPRE